MGKRNRKPKKYGKGVGGNSHDRRQAKRAGAVEGTVTVFDNLDPIVAEKMTVAQLRATCDERGIKTNTKLRKGELVEMLAGR